MALDLEALLNKVPGKLAFKMPVSVETVAVKFKDF